MEKDKYFWYYISEHDEAEVEKRMKEQHPEIVERERIRKEREGRMRPYFDLFNGIPARRSELPPEAIEATNILIGAGKFIEQLGVDGENIIYLAKPKNEH